MNDALLDVLRLHLVPGIGPRLCSLLLERFGSSRAVLAASGADLLQVDGIGAKLSAAITLAARSDEAEQELARCRERGISLLTPESDAYPRMLSEIPDPPPVLYCRGDYEERDNLAVAMVGSRQCTLYGKQQAERLAGVLARAGVTIVSGLARGIDAAAHRGALAAGGRTIAVSATGLGSIYPPEHAGLADEIAHSGMICSESPVMRGPSPGIFPQRNRIISGMSLAVVIVEAKRGSGALHTSRHAMEQGRDVFAVPGRIDSLASQGCHDLIRDGAALVRGPDDILEALGPLVRPVQSPSGETVHQPRELTLNEPERRVLNLVLPDPRHVDELLREEPEMEPSRVLATLTILEMKRLIRRLPGGYVVRAH